MAEVPFEPERGSEPQRARLMLVMRCDDRAEALKRQLEAALGGGDVAALILAPDKDVLSFQQTSTELVSIAHEHDVAVLIVENSQIMGRSGADGLHIGSGNEAIFSAIDKFAPAKMVGAGGIKTRHNALVVGEAQPDYVFFGKIDGDTHDAANPKSVHLAEWWSSMVEIPCVVMAGKTLESAVEVAKSGAEFVAMGSAIFSPDNDDPNQIRERVEEVNHQLDTHAPRFDEFDEPV